MRQGIKPGRVASIAVKEVRHVLRDPFTLAFTLGIPVLLVTFFGFIIDFNYRDIVLVLEDRDNVTFRTWRYAPDYAGFEGRDLTPGDPIEISVSQAIANLASLVTTLDLLN